MGGCGRGAVGGRLWAGGCGREAVACGLRLRLVAAPEDTLVVYRGVIRGADGLHIGELSAHHARVLAIGHIQVRPIAREACVAGAVCGRKPHHFLLVF